MFSKVFLAQTASEIRNHLPDKLCYMALHFSPYGKGLSNVPLSLPKDSIILLDDSMPVDNHDPMVVAEQLTELVLRFSPTALLMDFQRPANQALEEMAAIILQALPCPIGITTDYAKKLDCHVFLPPPPVNKSLKEYLSPWKDQGIYLEIAPECSMFTVTENGCVKEKISLVEGLPLQDVRLHCHYNVEVSSDRAVFTLCRYKEDLSALVDETKTLGVLGCIGLYQELKNL